MNRALDWLDDWVFWHGTRFEWLDALIGVWWVRHVCMRLNAQPSHIDPND